MATIPINGYDFSYQTNASYTTDDGPANGTGTITHSVAFTSQIEYYTDASFMASVDNLHWTIGYAGTLSQVWEWSLDGTTWNSVVGLAPTSPHFSYSTVTIDFALSPPVSAQYWRLSIQDSAPGTAEVGLVSVQPQVSGIPIGIPTSVSYCPNPETLTINGTWHRKNYSGGDGEPYQGAIVTVFYKVCHSPVLTRNDRNNTSTPLKTYCSDGDLFCEQVTTDCTGAWTWNHNDKITAVAVARGTHIINPNFNCQDTTGHNDVHGNADTWYFIFDPSRSEYTCCTSLTQTIKEGGVNQPPPQDINDLATNGCACHTCFNPGLISCFSTEGNSVFWSKSGTDSFNIDGTPHKNGLTGTITLALQDSNNAPSVQLVGLQDGTYYLWGGSETVTLGDTCGDSLPLDPGSGSFFQIPHGMDWWNINSVSISGTPNCASLTGTVINVSSYRQLYPTNKIHIPDNLCRCANPTFYIVMKDCSGASAVKFNAVAFRETIMIGWITSGNALKIACNHGVLGSIGNPIGNWETTQTIEASNADDIGLAYLLNGTAYLCYTLSGSNKYRTSLSRGTSSWSSTSTPSPSTSGHGDSGISDYQAVRVQAIGGVVSTSFCRDNNGAIWSSGVTVATGADNPYCGYAYLHDTAGVLYSTSTGADVKWKTSKDGLVSWSSATSLGVTGQVAGLARLSSGVLAGLLWDSVSKKTTTLWSNDKGLTWTKQSYYEEAIPSLDIPPQVVNIDNIAVACWVTGDKAQFCVSLDGGQNYQ